MGYEVHITRTRDWSISDSMPITFEEWAGFVADEDDIRPDPKNQNTDFLVKRVGREDWPLRWEKNGTVTTKNPDAESVVRMIKAAEKLGAMVVGDENERYYLENGDLKSREMQESEFGDDLSQEDDDHDRRSWRQRLIGFLRRRS